VICLSCFLLVNASQAMLPPVIPKPVSMVAVSGGPFEITRDTRIVGADDLPAAKIFQSLLQDGAGFRLRQARGTAGPNTIDFEKDTSGSIPREGYTMHVDAGGVKIGYDSPAGALYAIETLRQLLPPQIEDDKPESGVHWTVPPVEISDAPRFGWRGLMLDVSRHFYPVSFIKRYLDFLTMEKMNVFHWHLVDDGGWRIQIDHYPRLTSVGATRYGVTTGWDQSKLRFDPGSGLPSYGGFYTKRQIRDVIKYAADRNITIVPEIEMPGHSMPVFAAYPNLGCLNVPPSKVPGQPDTNVYCAGNPDTYTFIENVLSEVIDLFPSPYIHIGGDEVDKEFWHGCPRCQALMKDKGLKNEEELQSYFVKTIEQFVASKGRHLIGWDEILEGGLAPGAAVMSWRGEDGGIAAAQAGHDVVMSPTSYCYFDYPYLGQSTEHVYRYEPIPAALNADQAKLVLGGQANEWTEMIPTEQRAEYMIFPRVAALSEVLWSPKESRDYADFSRRLPDLYDRLDRQKISYHIEAPRVNDTAIIFTDSARVSVADGASTVGTLRYTVDGSTPSGTSPVYQGPITVTSNTDVHFAYVSRSGQPGDISTVSCRQSSPADLKTITPGWKVSYFEGEWSAVPKFGDLKPLDSSMVTRLGIEPRKRDENYALHFEGLFHAEQAGNYSFTLASDDGSWLKIGGATVVDNDGPHGDDAKIGHVRLSKGWHVIEVGYYQGGGAESLRLTVQLPGSSEGLPIDSFVAQPEAPL
jgi:hexosaminidase